MPLGLTVALLVLGGIVLAGIAGYLIEKSPEATKHLEMPAENIKEHHKNP
jgi:hypothetical protein